MNNGIELKNRIKKQIESIRNNSDIYELFKNLNYPKENIFDPSYIKKKRDFAFLENNKVNGNIKNHPEEIGKSQLMAFLTGRGTGYLAREVQAGNGFQDIIFVQDPKSPIIIETKVLSGDAKK